jgi:hypothetical protein
MRARTPTRHTDTDGSLIYHSECTYPLLRACACAEGLRADDKFNCVCIDESAHTYNGERCICPRTYATIDGYCKCPEG